MNENHILRLATQSGDLRTASIVVAYGRLDKALRALFPSTLLANHAMTFDANHPIWPTPATIADFSYSKLSHFELFRGLPFRSYNVGDPDPAICDLKVYQD